jgi:hypothetical protein
MIYDLGEARKARDEGIAAVRESTKEWSDDFRTRIWALPKGFTGTAEEIRLHVGIVEPPKPGAVGAGINGAVKRGWLEWTGEMRQPMCKTSHARKTQVWRRV